MAPFAVRGPRDCRVLLLHFFPVSAIILRNVRLVSGRATDVTIRDGVIAAIDPAAATGASEATGRATVDAGDVTTIDLTGYLLLPSAAEPHAHLDKALTADLIANPKGDLLGAIDAWVAFAPTQTPDQVARRAERAVRELLVNGVTAVRTHVNVVTDHLESIEALLAVRDRMGAAIDMQIVALTTMQQCGGPDSYRATLRAAANLDPCVVIGGCPHLDDDPELATDISLDVAGDMGRPLDLHTDENLDPSALHLPYLAQRVYDLGFSFGAAASHCVSLGVLDPIRQRDIAEQVAGAGVAVVTLPQTNLFLQGRDFQQSTPRGLTALRPLLDAGATLGAGADNVRDPFNVMGRSDPMETAALLVMAGHLRVEEAYDAVTHGARTAMGLAPTTVEVGQTADLMAIAAESLNDAVARADSSRIVLRRGRIVARSAVERQTYPSRDPADRQD